jgi:hypothetical protein
LTLLAHSNQPTSRLWIPIQVLHRQKPMRNLIY